MHVLAKKLQARLRQSPLTRMWAPILITGILLGGHLSLGILESW